MIAVATPIQAAALIITDAPIERFGLFVIIVLGETVTGVVDGLAHAPTDPLTLTVGLVAIMVASALGGLTPTSLATTAHGSRGGTRAMDPDLPCR